MQCFAPRHGMGTFMAGRVIIGAGQALAIGTIPQGLSIKFLLIPNLKITSRWSYLHRRSHPFKHPRCHHGVLANVLLRRLLRRLLGKLRSG